MDRKLYYNLVFCFHFFGKHFARERYIGKQKNANLITLHCSCKSMRYEDGSPIICQGLECIQYLRFSSAVKCTGSFVTEPVDTC